MFGESKEFPDPELVRRVDAEVDSWSLSASYHTGEPVSGGTLALITQRVSEEVGAPVAVVWTPYGLRGYPLASLAPVEYVRQRMTLSDQEAYDGLRIERGQWRRSDPEAKESYARFLRQEIGRIAEGGAHPPWMTRAQSIAHLEAELIKLDGGM